jgi:hypothetical protein
MKGVVGNLLSVAGLNGEHILFFIAIKNCSDAVVRDSFYGRTPGAVVDLIARSVAGGELRVGIILHDQDRNGPAFSCEFALGL